MTERYHPPPDEGPAGSRPRRRWPSRLFWLLGLALGLAVGLGYAWGLNPVQYYNTDPIDLRPQHKETWIALVAAAYHQDGDLDRALARLSGLQDPQIGRTVAQLTERYIQEGKPAPRIRALAALADALGARSSAMLIYLATPEPTLFFSPTPAPPTATATATPTPTDTPTPVPPTETPLPTPTATPTLRPTSTQQPTSTAPPPYELTEQRRICEGQRETPRIEIFVETKDGAGIAGSEIWVTWSGGADRFVTGLKPELGLGYADFEMAPDTLYAVAVGEPTLRVTTGLRTGPCQPGEGDALLASWRLTIVARSAAFTPTPSPSPPAVVTATPTPTRTPPPLRTRVIP